MAETEIKLRRGFDLVTPLDKFQGGEYASAVFTSGHLASGLTLVSGVAGMRQRLINAHFYNRDSGFITLELRDGGPSGPLVAGPFKIMAYSEKVVPYDQIFGRYATSSLFVCHTSGQSFSDLPVSNGVVVDVGFVREATIPIE